MKVQINAKDADRIPLERDSLLQADAVGRSEDGRAGIEHDALLYPRRTSGDFLRLAREQGVDPVAHLEDLMGGWPVEERGDGFEATLTKWRVPRES